MMKVTTETIARTIIYVICILNQILAILGKGKIDIAENDIYQLVSLIATIGSSAWAWWKNNSFTQPALKADLYLKNQKALYKDTKNNLNRAE